MALLLPSCSSLFLQDNIQLIIYSRTHSETIKKDIATMPRREQNRVLQCNQPSWLWELQRRGEPMFILWQCCHKIRWLTLWHCSDGSDEVSGEWVRPREEKNKHKWKEKKISTAPTVSDVDSCGERQSLKGLREVTIQYVFFLVDALPGG